MINEKYYDIFLNNTKRYRVFKEEVDERELMWHQDEWDRKILVLGGKDWKIQFDDELPLELKEGSEIQIENHKFHRVIKGNGNLIIRIIEINKN
jgi:hypothetical protein